jgi:hypothetical protein
LIEKQARKEDTLEPPLLVAVVGPCSAGKSTLLPELKAAGFNARSPAQEHSIVSNMWQRLTRPDILVYLDVNYEEARARRPHIDGGPQRLADQHNKLAHAFDHCDLYLDTSDLTPRDVRKAVLHFLKNFPEPASAR